MRRFSRSSRLIAVALILLACYALAGFVLVPYIIKSFVLPAVSERLQGPVKCHDGFFEALR